jgi:hypothetical protein
MSHIHTMHLGVPIMSPQKLKVGKNLNVVQLRPQQLSQEVMQYFFSCDVTASVLQ